jgi:hypothetical protein
MSKSDKPGGKTGAMASPSKSVLKTLDFDPCFIDVLLVRCGGTDFPNTLLVQANLISSSDEAELILNKWADEGTPVLAMLRVGLIVVPCRGFVTGVDSGVVLISSEPGVPTPEESDSADTFLSFPLVGSKCRFATDWDTASWAGVTGVVELAEPLLVSCLEINFEFEGWCLIFERPPT